MFVRSSILLLFLILGNLRADIIINELHIDEDDKTKPVEFIELHNTADTTVDLSDWSFTSGISYTFPAGSSIAAHGYLVIAQNPTATLAEFGYAGALGPWTGKLSNKGETVTLRDASGIKVDSVDYQLGFPWPTYGDAPSSSIELIHPSLDNDLGGHWRSSGNLESVQMPDIHYILRESTQWLYRKGNSTPAIDTNSRNWTENGYNISDDGQWLNGQTPIGYSDDDDNTVLTDMRSNYITFFMRHEFTIAEGQIPDTLTLRVLYDDGLVIYINGKEISRPNVPAGNIPSPPPDFFVTNHEANEYETIALTDMADCLVEGTNTIAVQLINITSSNSDATADIELIHEPDSLPSPGSSPTPGAINSVSFDHAPPAIRQVQHLPEQPTSNDPVTITAKITDIDGVDSVSLDYQLVAPGDYITIDDSRYDTTWTTLPMHDDGLDGDLLAHDDIYTVTLPSSLQEHRRLVRYRIRAADSGAYSITVPYTDDPTPNFAYFVYDSLPTWTGKATSSSSNVTYNFNNLPPLQQKVAVYQLITTRQEHVNAQNIPGSSLNSGYTGSNYLWQGTLVYNGEVYDHIRFRARGGFWRYAMGKNMWKFDFNRGHRFQARDDYGKKYDTLWSKLNFSAIIQQRPFGQRGEQGLYESVGFRLFNLAGSEACNTHYVHFRIIENASENGPSSSQFDDDFQGLYLAIEQMDGQYLEEHDLPDGNLYKMESGTGDSNNQGPDQPTNKSDLNSFLNTYNNTQSEQWWRDNLDLPRYYSYRSIVEAIRHYDIHAGKNYFYYNNPDSGKWQVHSWDLDIAWSNDGFGTGNEPFKSRVLAIPNLAQEYRNRMRSLRDLLLAPDQTNTLIDERMQFVFTEGSLSYVDADRAMWDYNPILVSNKVILERAGHGEFYKASVLTPDSYQGMAQKMRNYLAERSTWIDNNILTDSSSIPNTPSLSYTGPAGFPVDGISIESSPFDSPSGSSFAMMEYRIAEITDPSSATFDPASPRKYEIEETWMSPELTSFTPSQTIPSSVLKPDRTYRARVRHQDSSGRWSHWSAPLEFTSTTPDILSQYQQNLMITEIMFNPAEPTGDELTVSTSNNDFEWIELTNTGNTDLSLTDVRFTKGVDFDFPAGTTLAAGESILVVKNEAAFTKRYGEGFRIAGSYVNDKLADEGEQLKLSLGAGIAIHDFTYGIDSPWPNNTSQTGASLVLKNPDSAPDHSLATNWRASTQFNGTPTTSELASYLAWKNANAITSDTDDDDGDQLVSLIEYLLDSDPNVASLEEAPTGVLAPITIAGVTETYLTFTFQRRANTVGLIYYVEYSNALDSWSETPAILHSSTSNLDGSVTEIWRSTNPVSETTKLFMRLRAFTAE